MPLGGLLCEIFWAGAARIRPKKRPVLLHRPLPFLFLRYFHGRNALFQFLDPQLHGLSVPFRCRLDFAFLLLAHLGLGSLTVVHKFLLEMVGADAQDSLVALS
jgi:hypothetical protein